MKRRVRVYTDYKSPYAFVANRALFALEQTCDVELEWLPYTLRIAEYLGSVEDRSPHDWRKVRYAYKDARRFANEQGLVLKGPRRIYDGTLSSAGMLFARRGGFFRPYHDTVFERFWSHRLDIDVLDEMSAVVAELGGDAAAFEAYARGPAQDEVAPQSPPRPRAWACSASPPCFSTANSSGAETASKCWRGGCNRSPDHRSGV